MLEKAISGDVPPEFWTGVGVPSSPSPSAAPMDAWWGGTAWSELLFGFCVIREPWNRARGTMWSELPFGFCAATESWSIQGADSIRARHQQVAKKSRCDFTFWDIIITIIMIIFRDLPYSLHSISIFSTSMMDCRTVSEPAIGLCHRMPWKTPKGRDDPNHRRRQDF